MIDALINDTNNEKIEDPNTLKKQDEIFGRKFLKIPTYN